MASTEGSDASSSSIWDHKRSVRKKRSVRARNRTLSSVFVAALLLATIGLLRSSTAAAGPAGGAGLGGDMAPPGAVLTAVSVLRRLKERMQGAGEGAVAESSEGEAEASPMTLSVVDQVLDLVRCSDQDFQPATAPSGAQARNDESERPEGDSEATMHADTNNFLAGILSSSISWYADPERAPTPLRMVSAADEMPEDAVTQDEQDEQDEQDLSLACDQQSELSLVCESEHSREQADANNRDANGFSLDANGLTLVCESEHSQDQADANARNVAGLGVSKAEVSFMSSAVSSPTPPPLPPPPSPPPPPPLPPVPSVGPEQVLEYWFEGDWQTNFQKKWFTRAGSPDRDAVDVQVRARFSDLLLAAERGTLIQGGQHAAWDASPKSLVAHIILLDQFSRHIHRYGSRDAGTEAGESSAGVGNGEEESVDCGMPPDWGGDVQEERGDVVERNGRKALELTSMLVDSGEIESLRPAERVFATMPIRHFATVDSLRALLVLVSRWEAEVETGSNSDAALLKRYRRATQRRLDVLCDQGKRDGRILAQEEGVAAYSDVEEQLPREMLVRAVDKFVRSHVLVQGTAVVSLSGGVDSMVLCQVLCYLRDYPHLSHPASSPALKHARGSRDVSRRGPARAGVGEQDSPHERREKDGDATGVDARILHTVAAVHVDYGNRCESGEEASFLEAWCRGRGIKWFSTRAQVQRGAGDREAYEAETRDLRFALYRSALDATGARGVMLGHHRGDVEENVISNAMKGGSVLALGGMHPVQYMSQFKVEIQRPLLAMDKVEILDFATRYGVPYFKDTTPSWSTRGRLRRKLIPLLQDVYGDGVLCKMSSLAAEADELNSLLQMSVFAPFHAAVIEGPAGACVTRESFDVYVDYPIAFWKLVLRHVCLRAGAEVPREGSVKQMLDRQRKALGRERYQLASSGERGKVTRRGGRSGGQLIARANGSGGRDRSSQPGDRVAAGQAEDGQGGDRMGRGGEMRATWLQARQHSRTLLYGGGLYILNPALFPASPGGGDGVWWHRGQRLIVGRFYLLGPWNVTLALLPVEEGVASRDVEEGVEKGDIKQRGRECIGRASGSSGGSGEGVNEGEERQGGYRPEAAMTMMDVVKGLLMYELPLIAWRGEDEAEKMGGDADGGSGCQKGGGNGGVAWNIEPFARIAAFRLIPREVRALLPIVAPVGAPTTQHQERQLSHQAGVSHVVSARRGGRVRERAGGDGDVGASTEDTFRDSLARVLSVRRYPCPPTPERAGGAGGGHERRNGRMGGSEHLRGKSDGRRMGESRESSESSGVDTELEAGTYVEAGRGDWARRKVRVTLRALSTQ